MKPTDEEVERLAREMCRLDDKDPDKVERIRGSSGSSQDYYIEVGGWTHYTSAARTHLLARTAERSLALSELAKAEDAAREAEIARAIRSSKPWYPDDDPRWQEFTPGDPMPCDPDMLVEVVLHFERPGQAWNSEPAPARYWLSEKLGDDYRVVAWRPA